MKNIYKLLFLCSILLTVSCEEDLQIFDDNNGQQLLSFESTSSTLEIMEDGVGDLDVVVEVSTLSNSDRTFNLQIIDEETDALPGSFSVPSSVTIPAGSYEGSFNITGVDIDGLDPTVRALVLELSAPDDVVFTNQRSTINVSLICPVPDTYFLGQYVILNTEQFIGPQFSDLNIEETTVAVTVGSTPTERVFNARFLPRNNAAQPPNRFVIGLVCGNVVLANEPAFRPGNALILTESGNNATYDLNDDSVITVNYFENPNDTNGRTGREASFIMIKQ